MVGEERKPWVRLFFFLGLSFIAGLSFGYYLTPAKVEEKIVEKTKVVREESKKVTNRYDVKTGKVQEIIIETGTKETDIKQKKKEKKIENQKNFAIKVGGTRGLRDDRLGIRVGGEARLPIFNLWLGAEIDLKKSPTLGPYLRLEF